jgi:hypothetical protein
VRRAVGEFEVAFDADGTTVVGGGVIQTPLYWLELSIFSMDSH